MTLQVIFTALASAFVVIGSVGMIAMICGTLADYLTKNKKR